EILVDRLDAGRACLHRIAEMHGTAVHQHLAGIRNDRSGEHLDECRLAGTVVANHAEDLIRHQVEIGVIEGDDASEMLDKSARLQHGPTCVARCCGTGRVEGGAHAATFLIHWSSVTATMINTPTVNSCQSTSSPESARPLRNTPTISAPISVPMIEPRPPNRLVPPITTAVIESRFAVC